MALIGYFDPDYTIIGIIKETSYIKKYSAIDYIRDSLHMPMLAVTIYMFYMIGLRILHNALPKYVLHCKVCYYTSFPGVILSLHLQYIFVCTCIFVNHIMVYVLIYLCMSCYLIVCCSSSWVFFSMSLMWMNYSTTAPFLHMCLHYDFVNIIFMFTAIWLCTAYDLLLGCVTYWESCHAYFLYIICYAFFSILVDLHSQ